MSPNAIRQGRLAMINHVIGRDRDRYRHGDEHRGRERDRRSDRGRMRDNARDRDQERDRSRVTEASNGKEDKSKDKTGHDYWTEKASKQRFTRQFSSNSAEQNNFLSL